MKSALNLYSIARLYHTRLSGTAASVARSEDGAATLAEYLDPSVRKDCG